MKAVYDEANEAPEAKAAIETAIRRVEELNLDGVVRAIANSGGGDQHNKQRTVENLTFLATTGAGTQSATVRLHADPLWDVVYEASNHGQVLGVFHDGPWVERAVEIAGTVAAEFAAAQEDKAATAAAEVVARYSPLASPEKEEG